MENIFSNSFSPKEVQENTPILNQYDILKENYEKIFIQAAESIRAELDKFKPEVSCASCTLKCDLEKKDIFSDYPYGCAYKDWQAQALSFLQGEYRQKMKNTFKLLMEKKNEYPCNQCGDCCRLAVSEFSYEQLKQKAFRGDKYAKDFVSVFVPYKTEEEAKAVNPEFFETLNNLIESKAYYYYCPKLKDNLCSDYENRPNVCKEYPHNPLNLLPSRCSYNEWRNNIAKQALLLNAKADIIEFYKQQLG